MEAHRPKSLPVYAMVEIIFDIAYLCFAIVAGICMLVTAGSGNPSLALYGALALVLGCGDAFHLVPRIYSQLTGTLDACTRALGFGKLVTSVTMTVFYLLLCKVWSVFYGRPLATPLLAVLLVLAAVRIILCLFPQNRWFQKNPPLSWAIARNVPFLLLGILVIVLYASTAGGPFALMPIAITLSFLFYIPVVLFSQKYPAVGSLMLPKTAAYVWIICMGFGLL